MRHTPKEIAAIVDDPAVPPRWRSVTTMETTNLTPTPVEVEAVLASIQAGTHVYTEWLALTRIDDAESIKEETRIGNGLYWAELLDPERNVMDDDHLGCGNSPAEAAATAWVHRCLDVWPYPDRELTEEELLSVPRTVPPSWKFNLFAKPWRN